MFFSSGAEFFLIALFLLFQWGVRRYLTISWQRFTLLVGNIVILSTIISYLTLGLHIGISLLVFLSMLIVSKNQNKKGTRIATLSILTLIVLFCLRNYPKAFGFESFALGNSPELIIERLGISYILFRNIQSIIDSLKGRVTPNNPVDYINFILYFPNFLAGPIDKFSNFQRHFTRKEGRLKSALLWPGVGRITLGFLKKYALIPIFSTYALSYEPLLETPRHPKSPYSSVPYAILPIFSWTSQVIQISPLEQDILWVSKHPKTLTAPISQPTLPRFGVNGT